MSPANATPNGQSHSKTKRPPSRAKRSRSVEAQYRDETSSSDEESFVEILGKRSSSRLRSKKLNKRNKEESNPSPSVRNQEGKRSQKVQLDVLQPASKKLKTLCTLPDKWCRTKVSTISHTFEWTIENFSLFSLKEPGEAFWSSQFKIPKLEDLACRLFIYPNGHSDTCKNGTCVFIQLSENNLPEVDYELKLCNSRGTKISNAFNIRTNFCNIENKNSGVCRMAKRSELLALLNEDDALVVFCTLAVSDNIVYENSSNHADYYHDFQNKLEVLNDLYELRSRNDFCDVTFCIGKDEIFAHKYILAARSLYFGKLFESRNDKRVKIDIDGVKSSIFNEILRFLYTGKVFDIESTVYELFEAAWAFELPSLKAMCLMHFKKSLSCDNALDILNLADKVTALHLKQYTINYIVAHSSDILSSPRFGLLTKKLNPELMVQVFKELYA